MATAQGLQARTLYGPAETEYRRALKQDPTNAEAHYRLGALADRLGNTAGAEKEYRAALGVDAGHAAARTALADILVKRGVGARRGGELDRARRALEEAVTVQPGSSLARFELGLTYQAAGQLDEAIRNTGPRCKPTATIQPPCSAWAKPIPPSNATSLRLRLFVPCWPVTRTRPPPTPASASRPFTSASLSRRGSLLSGRSAPT